MAGRGFKKRLAVPNIKGLLQNKNIHQTSTVLDSLKKQALDIAPWQSAFPYTPKVHFSIAYTEGYIFLKYDIAEKAIRALNTEPNSPVYEDSCVEFFVSFDDKGYYNLECNGIGTMLMGFGKERSNRVRLPNEIIRKIEYFTTHVNNLKDKTIDWSMTLAIPFSIFIHHPNLSLSGKTAHANFYKCGDKLPEPHYLTWSNIEFVKPNFHLPEFFGDLVFE
jgi:Carbohydrate-binding family 9